MNIELNKKIDDFLANNKEEILKNLSTLVSCPSVRGEASKNAPFGEGTAKALETALEMSKKYNLETKNANWLYGTAKLVGKADSSKCIGIISHLDVVPAGNGWQSNPFEPKRTEKYLIGRGVMDDKSAAALGLAVMKFFSENNTEIDSSILLFFGCCEETGHEDIDAFVKNEPQPNFSLVPDTNFPVCHGEKGILGIFVQTSSMPSIINFFGGNAQNMVPDIAECHINFSQEALSSLNSSKKSYHNISTENNIIKITAQGISKHAAMPEGSANAIARLCELLIDAKILQNKDEISTINTIYECASSIHGEPYGLNISDKPSGKLTMINGTAKMENGAIILGYNMRYPVTTNGAEHIKALEKYFTSKGMKIIKHSDNAPCYLPADDPRIQTLVKIYEDLTGKDGTPYTMGGGTYSRYMKNAIGFGLESCSMEQNPDFPDGHGGIHQPDEALNIEEFMQAIRIYIHTVYELDKIL